MKKMRQFINYRYKGFLVTRYGIRTKKNGAPVRPDSPT
jgi:hypothetical protein